MVIVKLDDGSLLECSRRGWKVQKVGKEWARSSLEMLAYNLTEYNTPSDNPPDDYLVVANRVISEHAIFDGAKIAASAPDEGDEPGVIY